jgi:hypothetical protein
LHPPNPTAFSSIRAELPSAIRGFSSFFKLDTNTNLLTDYHITGPGLGAQDANLRTILSSDNSRVFFNDDGFVFSIDTATDTVFSATAQGCCYGNYDLALSENQIQFEASSYIFDSDLNPESFLAMNDREALGVSSYVYGAKFSPDGSLLFQPSTNGIDIFDGRVGNLRNRLALGFALSTNYDALVADGKDNMLIAITGAGGNGVAALDLSSISEPAPLPYSAKVSSERARVLSDHSGAAVNFSASVSTNTSKVKPMSGPRVIPYITRSNSLLDR